MTTKPGVTRKDGVVTVRIPLAPVPASRPRVTRWGTYYGKTYSAWKKAAEELLDAHKTDDPVKGAVTVLAAFVCKRPQKLTKDWPRGDVDNYLKAACDAITKTQCVWHDDDQIVTVHAKKRYAEPGEDPYTMIEVHV